MLIIKKAVFVSSIATKDRINEYSLPEIAIAGRSNVGKSSLINYLCNNQKLAKVSGTCGKTRLLNYFNINDSLFHLVDLPGYGYAEVAKNEKEKWRQLIESYLTSSKYLRHIFCLVDIRHRPNLNDIKLIEFLNFYSIPYTVIATKADKLSRQQREKQKQVIANFLNIGRDDVIVTSSSAKIGKEQILSKIKEIIDCENLCN